ncbi:MAG: baseplate J/gp47 family protein [Clostridium sp.]|nr:baseplate J/gp47 family protein [Clostridium sp.]
MLYDGVAPAMAELALLYLALDFVLQAGYISTAPREYLLKRAEERGLAPKPASAAHFRAEFDRAVPLGSRFSCEDLNFAVVARIDELSYQVVCETPGRLANSYSGLQSRLIPIDYIDGLTRAELVELLIPGEDEEETEAFRQRVLASFQTQAFGGNQADYREQVLAIAGVGGVKVHPVWNGNLRPAEMIPSEEVKTWYEANIDSLPDAAAIWLRAVYEAASHKLLTVGGTVRLVLLAADNTAPSAELVELVQTQIDPVQNAGEGLGLAPIGHVVQVEGVDIEPVNLELNLTYNSGWDWSGAESYVCAVIDAYFAELAAGWAEAEFLTVRISQIESRILSGCATMIADIGGTKINGRESNWQLGPDSIPKRGEVVG